MSEICFSSDFFLFESSFVPYSSFLSKTRSALDLNGLPLESFNCGRAVLMVSDFPLIYSVLAAISCANSCLLTGKRLLDVNTGPWAAVQKEAAKKNTMSFILKVFLKYTKTPIQI